MCDYDYRNRILAMEDCGHLDLVWEVRADISKNAKCIICSVKELKEEKARDLYGPGFSRIRYLYDEHKRELETLIMASCVDRIPCKYVDFMRQLCNRKLADSVIHSLPTGIGPNRSSMTITVPGVTWVPGVSLYDPPTVLDHPLDDPDDVPPNEGWHCSFVKEEISPEAMGSCRHCGSTPMVKKADPEIKRPPVVKKSDPEVKRPRYTLAYIMLLASAAVAACVYRFM